MPLLVALPADATPPIEEVGGKAHVLMQLAAAGFEVPPGWVLTAAFFRPWFEQVRESAAWRVAKSAEESQRTEAFAALQQLAGELTFNSPQCEALNDLRRRVAACPEPRVFAVRSSSPWEDMEHASFAGGYESLLGVRTEDLQDAVRSCFAASLSERIFVYKQQQGLSTDAMGLAVLVQRQIPSQVAGVAFSLNPLNNDYDQVLINANWGLGETVVAGLASPDQFIIDKPQPRVVHKERGAKQVAILAKPDGGTETREASRGLEWSLRVEQALEIAKQTSQIEEWMQAPVDVEWAVDAVDRLHILQARPITAFVPLPDSMQTLPGEKRRLYQDAGLSKGITINGPISRLGLDWMEESILRLFASLVGDIPKGIPPAESLWIFAGGRMYQNLSLAFCFCGPQRMASAFQGVDYLLAKTLENVDLHEYRAAKAPFSVLQIATAVPRILWGIRGTLWNLTRAVFSPLHSKRRYEEQRRETEERLAALAFGDGSLAEVLEEFDACGRALFDVAMPALAAGLIGLSSVERLAGKPEHRMRLAKQMQLGLPGNVVVEMGAAIRELGMQLRSEGVHDVEEAVERFDAKELPSTLLQAIESFQRQFGCRGPGEMDLVNPRYGDSPRLLFQQAFAVSQTKTDFDPAEVHQQNITQRRKAFSQLEGQMSWFGRPLLRHVHQLIEEFGGERDTPKHLNLWFHFAVRRAVLREAERFVQDGRLDEANDVFDLTLDDLRRAADDNAYDLRTPRDANARARRRLQRLVREFPSVIDSRGRILRPAAQPRGDKRGADRVWQGLAVSQGVATGPVKVLHSADEKTIAPGDILVAYTTDPGWTPLFANAAAILLEVGGVLQHGAVVAREFGKPCVTGIDGLTTIFQDGQRVEVDGSAGTVRLLSKLEPPRPPKASATLR